MSQTFTGTVVSNKMTNTVVVLIERKLRHPRYKKVMTKHHKIPAHNEDSSIKEGDVVTIRSTRPISKTKHFIVVSEGNKGEEIKKESKPVQEKKVQEVVKKVEEPVKEKKVVKKTTPRRVKKTE